MCASFSLDPFSRCGLTPFGVLFFITAEAVQRHGRKEHTHVLIMPNVFTGFVHWLVLDLHTLSKSMLSNFVETGLVQNKYY